MNSQMMRTGTDVETKPIDLMTVVNSLSENGIGEPLWKQENRKDELLSKIESMICETSRFPISTEAKRHIALALNKEVDSILEERLKNTHVLPSNNIVTEIPEIDENGNLVSRPRQWTIELLNAEVKVVPVQIISEIAERFGFIVIPVSVLNDLYRKHMNEEVNFYFFRMQTLYKHLWVLGPVEMYSVHHHLDSSEPIQIYGFGRTVELAYVIMSMVSALFTLKKSIEALKSRTDELNDKIEVIERQIDELRTSRINRIERQGFELTFRSQGIQYFALRDPLVFATSSPRFEEADKAFVIGSFLAGKTVNHRNCKKNDYPFLILTDETRKELVSLLRWQKPSVLLRKVISDIVFSQ